MYLFFFDLLYIRQFDCFQVLGSKFEAYQLFFSIILNNKTISFIIIISLTYLDYYFFASNGCCCCCFWFVVHMVCSLYCSLILLFTCAISHPKFHKTPPRNVQTKRRYLSLFCKTSKFQVGVIHAEEQCLIRYSRFVFLESIAGFAYRFHLILNVTTCARICVVRFQTYLGTIHYIANN